jgi:glycosyltransferase involved in cell wall biosynthesis
MAHTLSVILPAYNEAANIARVVEAVRAVQLAGVEITPVVVNDGSKDATAELAERAGATVVSHPVNRGVGAGFRTGLDWALEHGSDYLIHMDSDGQVQAHEIPELFKPVARDEADLALGSRFLDGDAPENLARWKSLALTTMARTIGIATGYHLTDISCGFRCMNRKVMEAVRPTFDYDYIQETLIQALAIGARVVEVPVHILYEREPARAGMSGRTLRYSRRFLGITAYSMANFYKTRAGRLLGR